MANQTDLKGKSTIRYVSIFVNCISCVIFRNQQIYEIHCSVSNKINVKMYGNYSLTGIDFGTIHNVNHRLTFSPNNVNPVHINCVGEKTLVFTNNANINFEFSISRGNVPMALVEYNQNGIVVNKRWRITGDEMVNRELDVVPINQPSRVLNFEIGATGNGRFDVKYDKKDYVALFFDHRKMYMARFNGDYAQKHFEEFISRESERRPLDIVRINQYLSFRNEMKFRIIRKFIVDWLKSNNADQAFDSDAMVRRFLSSLSLEHVLD